MTQRHSRIWLAGFLLVEAGLALMLTRGIADRWQTSMDYNAVVWCQAAHNYLRAGIIETAGVPSSFHFGPPPILVGDYYLHHPPLLPLLLAGVFAVLGESEWAARLLPILSMLAAVAVLWLLVRDELGERAATLTAALLAATPMVLHYGSMVNFEPCNLPWMLAAAYACRQWQKTGRRRWLALLFASLLVAMEMAWMGHFFALTLAVYWLIAGGKMERKLSGIVVAMAVGTAVLFLLQTMAVDSQGWLDMTKAVFRRTGIKGSTTWMMWLNQMWEYLSTLILAPTWLMAAAGMIWMFRRRRTSDGTHYLWSVCACFAIMNLAYIVVFRNAAYHHGYSIFYLALPLAILGGIALDAAFERINQAVATHRVRRTVPVAIAAILFYLGITAAVEFQKQRVLLHILDENAWEPPDLAYSVGLALRKAFPEDTVIFCNFQNHFLPLLAYYAQRNMIAGLPAPENWKPALAGCRQPHGALIWMNAPHAEEILGSLPDGKQTKTLIEGIPFVLWKAADTSFAGIPR
ncbi:MAG: glycosyltransferase family 39 protein [Verrucomicrobia bacterium]|nr:glycosyltransferase family 39 protein [Verrucomicrobiota bacterium]